MKKICVVIGILISMIVTGILVQAKEREMQQNLAKEVFRFHVLANSDSGQDQCLKMKVKEKVLAYMKEELPYSQSVDTTKEWAKNHLEEITILSEKLIEEEGYFYGVKATVENCYFPQKTYGDITFPAGEYEALRIEIGKAEGRNWWCVLYPNLCFIDAVHAVVPEEGKNDLKNVLEEDTYHMVTSTSRFKIYWRIKDVQNRGASSLQRMRSR